MALMAETGELSGLLALAADPAVAPYLCGAGVVNTTTAPGEQAYARYSYT
jgi:hypothetical protein